MLLLSFLSHLHLLLFLSSLTLTLAQESDAEVTAQFEQIGACAYFIEEPKHHSPLEDTCKKYCEDNGPGTGYYQCDVNPYYGIDFDHDFDRSSLQRDDYGELWVPCKCICENKEVEDAAAFFLGEVIEGLARLDNVICAVMLESFKIIVDVGINFVPGGQVLNGAKVAVQGAKTFAENGLEAADFFGNWVGKACGMPEWDFDLWGDLIGAPDDYGTSIGCKKKKKSDCKKLDSKPTSTKKGDSETTSTEKEEPSSTTTDKESTTTNTDKEDSTTFSNTESEPTTISTKKDDSTSTGSKTEGSSTSSTSTSTTSSDSCEATAQGKSAANCEKTTPCNIQNPDNGDEDVLPRRDGHRSPRREMLLKRDGKKDGYPCNKSPEYKSKFTLEADTYPSNVQLDENTPSYGWRQQDNLCDYDWQSGTKRNTSSRYDSEHVMEWQIVTDFFAKLNDKSGTKFEHPDPRQGNKMVDFCTYWIESWGPQSGPESTDFSINSSPTLTPWKHIAAAYPSKHNYKEEMVRLQWNINQQAKANLFKDDVPMIWNEGTMKTMVKSNRNKVLERLRLTLGAQKYLTETKVKDIFKDQKTRMGNILDNLDKEMETHPRAEVNATTGAKTTYHSWKRQELLTEWNAFMDSKWDAATVKHKLVMDTWTKRLNEAHCKKPGKKGKADGEFCDRLINLGRLGATAWRPKQTTSSWEPGPSSSTQTSTSTRRGAQRAVPMRVLCLGLPRTGTQSMQEAMAMLGYASPYHFSSMFANLRDAEMWQTAMWHRQRSLSGNAPHGNGNGNGDGFDYRAHFDQLLGHCEAVCDVPGAALWRELVAAYPEARVVLVERDLDRWVRSMEVLLDASLNPVGQYLFRYLDPTFFGRIFKTSAAWVRLLFGSTDKARCKARLREVYENHYADVRAEVSSERLLNYRLGSGWGPLCKFLGKRTPDVEFPHRNEAKTLEAAASRTTKLGLMNCLWDVSIGGGVLAVVAGVIYARFKAA
ncbi:MAG: hypothetical protein Q9160_003940 [Pyrenula sp. 1 TL-2023]